MGTPVLDETTLVRHHKKKIVPPHARAPGRVRWNRGGTIYPSKLDPHSTHSTGLRLDECTPPKVRLLVRLGGHKKIRAGIKRKSTPRAGGLTPPTTTPPRFQPEQFSKRGRR